MDAETVPEHLVEHHSITEVPSGMNSLGACVVGTVRIRNMEDIANPEWTVFLALHIVIVFAIVIE